MILIFFSPPLSTWYPPKWFLVSTVCPFIQSHSTDIAATLADQDCYNLLVPTSLVKSLWPLCQSTIWDLCCLFCLIFFWTSWPHPFVLFSSLPPSLNTPCQPPTAEHVCMHSGKETCCLNNRDTGWTLPQTKQWFLLVRLKLMSVLTTFAPDDRDEKVKKFLLPSGEL